MPRGLEWECMHSTIYFALNVFLVGLETLFGIGLIGCTIVLLMSFWDDVKTILGQH